MFGGGVHHWLDANGGCSQKKPPKKKQEQRKSLWNMLLRRLGRPGLVSSASKHGGSRFNNNGELRLFFSDDCIDAKT